jgi:hypothetical protein
MESWRERDELERTFRADAEVSIERKIASLAQQIGVAPEEIAEKKSSEAMHYLKQSAGALIAKFPIGSTVLYPIADKPFEVVITEYPVNTSYSIPTGFYGFATQKKIGAAHSLNRLRNAELLCFDPDHIAVHIQKMRKRMEAVVMPWLKQVPRAFDVQSVFNTIVYAITAKMKAQRKNTIATIEDITDDELMRKAKDFMANKYNYWD